MKIGIVGKGYVGTAMYENFKNCFEVAVWDVVEEKRTIDTFESFVDFSDIIFVCVPTPSNEDGSCDTSVVEGIVKHIAILNPQATVVIKSTVPPGTTENLSKETRLKIAFNPEFLTEANYVQDFRYQPLIVVGTDDEVTSEKVWSVYYEYVVSVGYMPLMKGVTTKEAEMFKYLANCFLATKVIFANEFKILCDKIGVEYGNVANVAKLDSRLGPTHWKVPGPDGKLGFGGSCFPKDTSAMVAFSDQVGSALWLLTEATYINDEIRNSDLYQSLRAVEENENK
jgi:UDPglucose 6-dehydrogenase